MLGGSGATMPPPACEIARHVIDAFGAKDYERAGSSCSSSSRCFPQGGCTVAWRRDEGGDEPDRHSGSVSHIRPIPDLRARKNKRASRAPESDRAGEAATREAAGMITRKRCPRSQAQWPHERELIRWRLGPPSPGHPTPTQTAGAPARALSLPQFRDRAPGCSSAAK